MPMSAQAAQAAQQHNGPTLEVVTFNLLHEPLPNLKCAIGLRGLPMTLRLQVEYHRLIASAAAGPARAPGPPAGHLTHLHHDNRRRFGGSPPDSPGRAAATGSVAPSESVLRLHTGTGSTGHDAYDYARGGFRRCQCQWGAATTGNACQCHYAHTVQVDGAAGSPSPRCRL